MYLIMLPLRLVVFSHHEFLGISLDVSHWSLSEIHSIKTVQLFLPVLYMMTHHSYLLYESRTCSMNSCCLLLLERLEVMVHCIVIYLNFVDGLHFFCRRQRKASAIY